jgi:hypothetical protein
MMKLLLFMLSIAFAGCEDELFGPDLGPTAGPEHNGLRIEVSFPDSVGVATQVAFHVTLTNTRTTPYTMPQPHFDIFVIDDGGDVVWNYLFGAGVFGDEVVIAPGEAFEIDLVWNQNRNESGNIAPGKYSVLAAFFDLPPALVSERESIVISRGL